MKASPLLLHSGTTAGFDEPFDMLRACHERVQRMCGLLLRLQQHLHQQGADEQARQAATDVMRYFDSAGPAHHEDEERHLLPWLRSQGQATLAALADQLAQEHVQMTEHWTTVRTGLAAVAAGHWDATAAQAADAHWPVFAAQYQQHIETEERLAYPPAQAALTRPDLAKMGTEMAARRGLPAPPGSDSAASTAALEWLAQRHSVGPKHLGLPAPTAADLAQAAALASRAPDHLQLRPYRFVQVADTQRSALAALFAQAARRRGQDDAAMHAAAQRAHNGPALLALVVRLHPGLADAPEHEQWLAAGAALMNFINALHLQGFGAKVLSGASIKDAALQAAFCETDEQLVAWIVAGTPKRRAHERAVAATHPHAVLEEWHPRAVLGAWHPGGA